MPRSATKRSEVPYHYNCVSSPALSMNPYRKLVHSTRMPIRWGDMDAMGHVNNTVYFRYMEQARIDWVYAFAQGEGRGAYAGDGPLIVNARCTFFAPLTYPGEEIGRASCREGV